MWQAFRSIRPFILLCAVIVAVSCSTASEAPGPTLNLTPDSQATTPTPEPTATPAPSPTPALEPTSGSTPSPTSVLQGTPTAQPLFSNLECRPAFDAIPRLIQRDIRVPWPSVRSAQMVFDGESGEHLFIAVDLEGTGAPPNGTVPVWYRQFDQETGNFLSDLQTVNVGAQNHSYIEVYDGLIDLIELPGYDLVQKCVADALASAGESSLTEPGSDGIAVEVDLTPNWTVGQAWNYEIDRMRDELVERFSSSTSSSTSRVRIEVLEATPNGYVVGYTLTAIVIPETGNAETDLVIQGLADLTIDLTFEIEMTTEAVMVGVRNIEEVLPVIEEALDRMVDLIVTNLPPDQAAGFKTITDSVLSNYATEQGILLNGLPEMDLFSLSFGWVLDLNEQYTQEGELPNPLGGANIPATTFLKLIDPEPDDSLITFVWSQYLGGAQAEQALFETLLNLAETAGGPTPVIDDIKGITRRDEGLFVVDTSTWTLTELLFSETVTILGISKTDARRFTLLP